jgi:hypothetical protein
MHRAGKLVGSGDAARRLTSYERVLNLVDLTVLVQRKRTLLADHRLHRELAELHRRTCHPYRIQP